MDTTPSFINGLPPPPPPSLPSSNTVDFTPLEFILGLIAVIAIPALAYAFFFSIQCPPSPRHRRHRDFDRNSGDTASTSDKEGVSDFKYEKEEEQVVNKDVGSECPVCLSVMSEGEEVRQLSACKHTFHVNCIDTWLNSQSNCPVCRASIAVNQPNNPNVSATSLAASADLQQSLPDASNLV